MENKTKVNININQGAVKMGNLIENGKNLRRFLYFIVIMGIVVLPIMLGISIWIAKQ